LNTKAFLMALFTVLIWGSTFAAIRVGLHGGFSAGHLILLRYLIASGLFAIYAVLPGVKFRLPRRQDVLKIMVLGWIGISIYHLGVTFGERTVKAGTAAMLIGSGPIFTAFLAVFILKERLSKWGWAGLAIGFIGIFIITLGTSGSPLKISKEAAFILIAALATSIMFVYQKSLYTRYTSIELTAYFTWAGTLPFLIFSPGLLEDIQQASFEASLSAVLIGVFPTAIGYVTWAVALSAGKASAVSSMLYLEPVAAIIVAWFWIQELPNTISVIGGIIAISGVILVNMKSKNREILTENTTSNILKS